MYTLAESSLFIIPKYSTFQIIISDALKKESSRLQKIIQSMLPQYAIDTLDQLLLTGDQYYELTTIKKDQKKFLGTKKFKKLLNIKLNVINYITCPIKYYQSYSSHKTSFLIIQN